MRAKTPGMPYDMDIYAIYEIKGEKYYLALLPKNEGLNAYRVNEVDIIDDTKDGFVEITKGGVRAPGLYHEAILQDNLIESLLEFESGAVEELRRRLSSRNLLQKE